MDSSGYYKILEYKYISFLVIASIYFISIILVNIYYKIKYREKIFEKRKISKVQIVVLLYWIINIISTIFSPFASKYNLLIGTGRGEGLINISLYVWSFLCITIYGKFKEEHIKTIILSALLFSTVALIQFIGFNPYNIFRDGMGIHNLSFMGTIGNINFIAAFYSITLTISVAYIIFNEKIKEEGNKIKYIICYLAVFTSYIIFQVINVNSIRVGIICTLLIYLPYILFNNIYLSKFLKVLTVVMLAYVFNLIVNPTYVQELNKIVLDFKLDLRGIIFAVLAVMLYVLSNIVEKYKYDIINKKNIIRYAVIFVVIVVLVLTIIYAVDLGEGYKLIYEIHEIMHGNLDDRFGTFRLFLYKRTIQLADEYTLLGTGADSFAIRFMEKYEDDIKQIGPLTINDNSGNVYLTMLINIGVIGMLTYILFLILMIAKYLKNKKINGLNKESIIIMSGIICYLIQDLFNLWVVIVTPVFWSTIAVLYLSLKKEKIYEERNETNKK